MLQIENNKYNNCKHAWNDWRYSNQSIDAPPKVNEREWIEFPEPSDITVRQMIDGHTALIEDIGELKESVSSLEKNKQSIDVGYVGIGVIGIVIALVALTKSKKLGVK